MKPGVRQFAPQDVISYPELRSANPKGQNVSWMDSYKASFEADSSALNYLNSLEYEYPEQIDYNPVQDVPSDMVYYMDEYLGSKSPGQSEQITARLKYEGDRVIKGSEHITAALLGSFSGTLFGSPEYLPLMLWAPGALGRAAVGVGRAAKTFGAMRHVVSAAKVGGVVAAEEVVHESLLQQSTLSRTLGESAVNVATAGLFGATIGGVSSALMRGRYIDQVTDEANDAVNGVAAKRMEDFIGPDEHLIFDANNRVKLVKDVGDKSSTTSFNTVSIAEAFLRKRAGDESPMMKSAGAQYAGLGEDAMPVRAKWRNSEMMRKAGVSTLRSANVQLERSMLHARSEVFQDEIMGKTWGHTRPTAGTEKGMAKPTALSRKVERKIGSLNHLTKKDMYNGFFEYLGKSNSERMRNNTKINRMVTATVPKYRKQYVKFNDRVNWAIRNNNKDPDGDPFIEATATKISARTTAVKDRAVGVSMYGTKNVPVKDDLGNMSIGPDGKPVMKKVAIDPGDNVKYAESWGADSWNAPAIRRDRTEVQKFLKEGFEKERRELAEETQKAVVADKIIKNKKKQVDLRKDLSKLRAKNNKIITRAEDWIEARKAVKKPSTAQIEAKGRRKEKISKAKEELKRKNTTTTRQIAKLKENVVQLEKDYKEIGSAKWLERQINEYDLYETVPDDVITTFENMVNGKIGGRVYGNPDYKASSTKERKVPIHDNDALHPDRMWLDTDVLSWTRNYYESTLRPTMMKELHGDTEMEAITRTVIDDYAYKSAQAMKNGDIKLANSFGKEARDMAKQNRVALNRYYHRSLVPKDPEGIGANLSRILRDFNVGIRMGGVAPTSLSDVGRYNMAKIYAPEIGTFGTTIKDALKSSKVNKEYMQDGGIAHEVTMNVRAAKMLGNDDPNPAAWKVTRFFDKMAYGLMRASALGELTDFGKLTVSNLYQNELFRMAKNWDQLTPKTKSKLALSGYDESMARGMMKEFDLKNIKYLDDHNRAVATNYGTWSDQDLAERFIDVVFNKSEQKLATPTELTAPIWADNEFAKLILQFKSFSLAAHSQVTVPLANRLADRDMAAYQTVATALAMGVITEVIKAILSGEDAMERLDNYTPSDWVYAAIDRGALIPLLMIGFNGLDTLSQNNLSKMIDRTSYGYPSRHDWTQGMGPSAGLVTDMYDLVSGTLGGNFNQRDLHTLRKLMPFNNLAWINRPVVSQLEKGVANVFNVPSGKRKSKSRVRQ